MKRPPIRELPVQSELLARLRYDEETGKLFWREHEGHKYFNTRFAGKEAGYKKGFGYLAISWEGMNLLAHRVIWKMKTGKEPAASIDHIDGDQSNNRWNNLREVSHDQNMWNAKLFRNNKSGYRGISFIQHHQKWRAAISVNGKKQHLGYFNTPELAHAAFKDATFKMRDEFARVA